MRTYPRHAARSLAAALLTVLVIGCADDDTGSPSPDGSEHAHDETSPPRADAPTVRVAAGALTFDPGDLELRAGEPVNLALSSSDTLHDLTIDEIGFHVAADAGQTATGAVTFERAGTYVAYCSVPGHRDAGMEFLISVG